MASQLNNAPLGWGILGTTNGYQYSVQGLVEQQYKCAVSWDLNIQMASALPAVDQEDKLPIYAVRFEKVNGGLVTSVIQYFSIHQQESYRTGTFFGAFIENVNQAFHSDSAKQIIDGLTELSIFQWDHFIDQKKFTYKQDIQTRPFTSPEKQLTAIADKLLPLHSVSVGERVLFINASKEDEEGDVTLTQILKQPFLSLVYKAIYFSTSAEIVEKAKKIGGIVYFDSLSAFVANLPNLLNEQILLSLRNNRKLSADLNKKNSEFEQVKQAIENKFHQKMGELMQQQQNEVAQLKQNLANTQQHLLQASQKSQAWDNLIHWVIANNNIEGELKASQQQLSEEIKKLMAEYQRLNSEYQSEKERNSLLEQEKYQLSHKLKAVEKISQNINPEMVSTLKAQLSSARFMSVIWGVLFTISLFSIVGLVYFGTFTSSEGDELNKQITVLKNQVTRLETEKTTLEGEKQKNDDAKKLAEDQLRELNTSQENLKNKFTKYCDSLGKKERDKCKETIK